MLEIYNGFEVLVDNYQKKRTIVWNRKITKFY
jgi:hypothetical protein